MSEREKAERPTQKWLRALGGRDLPRMIVVEGQWYEYVTTFKHDFFAATGLYDGPRGKVVLKVMRQVGIWGAVTSFVGPFLRRHEAEMYRLLAAVDGVPKIVGLWGPTGYVHEYIEGRPLRRNDSVPDDFFPKLSALLDAIHARDTAYVDLEKPENIILGADGSPYLIDFQISWHLPANRGGGTWVARFILEALRGGDGYHLLKHWRRIRPDQLAAAEIVTSYQAPFWIRWHRTLFRPLTRLRRLVLVWLGARTSARGRSPG